MCPYDGPMRPTIALTGGIASGKTAVSRRLAELGASIIDSDVLAREVVEPGTPALAAIAETFGPGVLRPDGSLDRPALGALVFSDVAARAALNAIVHPAVRRRARELMAASPPDAVVVNVIPLLVETGQAHDFDIVVVVDVPVEVQVARLVARNGLTRAEAEARLAAQASREQRLAVADEVIDNSGTPADLRARVDDLWRRLRRDEAPRRGPWAGSPAHGVAPEPPPEGSVGGAV